MSRQGGVQFIFLNVLLRIRILKLIIQKQNLLALAFLQHP